MAFAIAILVDEGRLKWDTRVQEIIPEFKVMDQKVSKEATIMDLLVSAFRISTDISLTLL